MLDQNLSEQLSNDFFNDIDDDYTQFEETLLNNQNQNEKEL